MTSKRYNDDRQISEDKDKVRDFADNSDKKG